VLSKWIHGKWIHGKWIHGVPSRRSLNALQYERIPVIFPYCDPMIQWEGRRKTNNCPMGKAEEKRTKSLRHRFLSGRRVVESRVERSEEVERRRGRGRGREGERERERRGRAKVKLRSR
jgi:hypothetical protein